MTMLKINADTFPKPYGLTGTFFKVVNASGAVNVRFEYHDDSELETVLYQGLAIEHPKPFKSFFLSSQTPQDLTVFASLAKLVDDRLETSLTGAASLQSGKATLTANQAGEIVPARLGRRSVLIFCDALTYIGGAGLDVETGIRVDAGESLEINTQAAVFGFSPTTASVRTLEELN
ncbi:hypothetical protein [Grimontia sp. NTOU-MAR1]|uniref:hypothetical protein n=1 Tax=Grimontia sp. NTOU-MAR1 TaxID=3111011 RepID=UPI002DB6EAC5|nr:hypothetical protein [Grimontia sp. NTOU-MAR1]WRV98260.1 hypothetical protein VP504_02145 [Grimontia sp. NTOU-MAR1]